MDGTMFEKRRQSLSLTEKTRYSDPNNKDINCKRNECNHHRGLLEKLLWLLQIQ